MTDTALTPRPAQPGDGQDYGGITPETALRIRLLAWARQIDLGKHHAPACLSRDLQQAANTIETLQAKLAAAEAVIAAADPFTKIADAVPTDLHSETVIMVVPVMGENQDPMFCLRAGDFYKLHAALDRLAAARENRK